MKNNDPIHSRFDDLLFLLVEDALDEEGIRYIENWLSSGNEAKQYYFNFIKDYVGMKHQANSMIDMNEETFSIHDAYDAELWSALAEVERISESIPDDNHADEEPPLIEKVERKRVIKKSNKFSIGALMASAAAILFIVLFSKIVPTANIEVATLTSSIDASRVLSHISQKDRNGSARALDYWDRLFMKADSLIKTPSDSREVKELIHWEKF